MFKPFKMGSLEEIERQYVDQPFLLSFWSIDCPPCIKEFKLFKQILAEQPDTNIVLVSTDEEIHIEQAAVILKEFSLDNIDNWIFAEEFVERLRYEIDPRWTGAIPQAFFYTRNRQRIRVTGALDASHFEQWRAEDIRSEATK